MRPVLPLVALALTVVLCAVPVAQVADVLRATGLSACTPVILLHTFGYLLGYALPRLLGFNEKTARTGEEMRKGYECGVVGWVPPPVRWCASCLRPTSPPTACLNPHHTHHTHPLFYSVDRDWDAVGCHGLCTEHQALWGRAGGGALLRVHRVHGLAGRRAGRYELRSVRWVVVGALACGRGRGWGPRWQVWIVVWPVLGGGRGIGMCMWLEAPLAGAPWPCTAESCLVLVSEVCILVSSCPASANRSMPCPTPTGAVVWRMIPIKDGQ